MQRLWRERRLKRLALADGGGKVQVVFPGWEARNGGPDFRGAVLETAEGSRMRGDVEIHVDSAGWRQHGHDQDPAYRGVALQVVWQGDRQGAARTIDGRVVPTATAARAAKAKTDARPCTRHQTPLDAALVAGTLDELGDRRFREKAVYLAAQAIEQGPEQALWRALLRALGYSRNQEPFAALGERVPWPVLGTRLMALGQEERLLLAEAMLFGRAGLLPSQRGLVIAADSYADQIEETWRSAGVGYGSEPLAWATHGLRPENSAPRRLAAAAALAARWLAHGPIAPFARVLSCDDLSADALEGLFAVSTSGYWASNWDFGKPCRPNPTLLGAGRAGDIVVNVILPFFCGCAMRSGDKTLEARALALYRAWPPLAPNGVTREMERMLLPDGARRVVTSARRQQGLLHLYRTRCTRLRCAGCALG